MTPIQRVVAWADILRFSVLAQLLETEFFPKWLEILHIWLVQPRVNFAEVAQWYEDWRKALPESTKNLDGFTRGLQLINKALELGPDAPSKLPKPDHPSFGTAGSKGAAAGKAPPSIPKISARAQEITFREIVEEYASKHNLLLVPTGRAHELSRMPLFRVSKTADGRGGLVIYILDDAVWAPDKDAADSKAYRAISLEDMVVRANK
jgi:tuftelin-interacting protein 11